MFLFLSLSFLLSLPHAISLIFPFSLSVPIPIDYCFIPLPFCDNRSHVLQTTYAGTRMEYQQNAFATNLDDASPPSTGVERWFCGSIEGWVSERSTPFFLRKKEIRRRDFSKH